MIGTAKSSSTAAASPEGGPRIFDSQLGRLVPVRTTPREPTFDASEGVVTRDETEEEEALIKESEVARMRAEREYASSGVSLASSLITEE